MEWIPLEEFDFTNEDLVLINVDTRDFYVIGATEDTAISEPVIKYPTRVIGIDKIKEALFRFKETSGGEREWRHFDIVGTKYSNRWDFKYLRFRKSPDGWLFINDDYDKVRKQDSAYPAEFLDNEGVDWVDHHYKNRPLGEEVNEFSKKEFETYDYIAPDSFTIYNNLPRDFRDYPKPPQYRRETPKIQNNEPCSCGSNKKFKRCCK